MLMIFLLSIALTLLLTGITFPIHMGLLLYYLPEELIDKAFIFNTALVNNIYNFNNKCKEGE